MGIRIGKSDRDPWGNPDIVNIGSRTVPVYGMYDASFETTIRDTLSKPPAAHAQYIQAIMIGDRVGPHGGIEEGGATVPAGESPLGVITLEVTGMVFSDRGRNAPSTAGTGTICITFLHELGHHIQRHQNVYAAMVQDGHREFLSTFLANIRYGGRRNGNEDQINEVYWRLFGRGNVGTVDPVAYRAARRSLARILSIPNIH